MKNIKKCFAWILLVSTFEGCRASSLSYVGTNYRLIRKNADGVKIEKVEITENLEYPRRRKYCFRKVQQMWENYYRCLQISGMQERKPEIRRLVEGQHTEFPCILCPRPFQNYAGIEWKYKPLSTDSDVRNLEHLDLAQEMTLTRDKTLRIYNVVEDFAGLYVCRQKKNVVSVYVLEVSKNDTTEKVRTYATREKLVTLEGKDFGIHYQWTKWTECSSCGHVGRRYKYGTCFISSKKSVSLRTKSSHAAMQKNKQRNKEFFENPFKARIFVKNSTSEDSTHQNWGVETIAKFSTGIPCASRYLPRAALAHTQSQKPVKVAVKYCLERCDEYQIFEAYDANGNMIERANNSAGIYSVHQQLPQLPLGIKRKSVTAEFGKDIIIQCPGTLLSTIPVTWKIDDKIVFPEVVAVQSKGRFIVDLMNRIQIKKLRLRDSDLYCCWQRNKLIGAVNLNVEKKFKISFDHHITLIGIVAIIGIFLIVGSNAITRELKLRKR